jgi:hypothetical protein
MYSFLQFLPVKQMRIPLQVHVQKILAILVQILAYNVAISALPGRKGQCHEIFDPRFFRQSITPRPLINTLKYFRILFGIRRAIRN